MADKLPVEVVSHIMQFISPTDRRDASLVSRNWHEASLHPLLHFATTVTYHIPEGTDEEIKIKSKSPNLVIDNSSSKNLKLFEPLAEQLQTLSFRGSDITHQMFSSFIVHCHNLRKLDLGSCNSLFMSGKLLETDTEMKSVQSALVNVVELDLSSIKYLADVTFNRIVLACSNVKKLSLAACNVLCYSESYRSRACASSSLLTFDNVLEFVRHNASKLRSLNFSQTTFNDECLEKMSTLNDLKLEELYLNHCVDFNSATFSAFCKGQCHLNILELNSTVLTNSALYSIQEHLPNLTHLAMANVRELTDSSMNNLHAMSKLKYLDLSASYNITGPAIAEGLSGAPLLQKITHLSLGHCPLIGDAAVAQLTDSLKSLEVLNLASCASISDLSVMAISQNCKHLTSLSLGWTKNITDFGILGIAVPEKMQTKKSLVQEELVKKRHGVDPSMLNMFIKPYGYKELVTEHRPTLDEMRSFIETFKGNRYGLDNLSSIQSLHLTNMYKVTDASLALVMKFKHLQELNLSMCSGVSDLTLAALSEESRSIQVLKLAQCPKISDAGLESVAGRCPRLETLDISSCHLVTDKGLQLLLSCTKLKNLDVSYCSGVTQEAIEKLQFQLKNLVSVTKNYI